jgi:hypothetical protein
VFFATSSEVVHRVERKQHKSSCALPEKSKDYFVGVQNLLGTF